MWLGLTLCLAGLLSHAAAPTGGALRLDASLSDVDAWPWVSVLEEGERRLGADEAYAARAAFGPPPAVHGNLGVRDHAVWVRVPLQRAAGDTEAWWLDLGFAGVDHVDGFVFQGGQVVHTFQVRNSQPFSQKPLPTRSHVLPLPAPPGGSYELLMRFESPTAMLLPLRFARPAEMLASESRQQVVQGLIGGVWLCLLVYALVQGAVLRERMFFAFALSSAAGSVFFLSYYGQGPQHLWGENVWMASNGWAPAILAMVGANAVFVHDALGVSAFNRKLAMALRAVAIGAAASVLAFLTGLIDLRLAALAASVLGPLPTLLGTVAAAQSMRRGNPVAPLVLAGWVVVLLGSLTMVCLQRGWLPLSFWAQHALQFAMTIEIVLWMFVLARRVKDVRVSEEAVRLENTRLQTLAFSDPLTGLLNRRGLTLALDRSLAAGSPASLAVYLLDLDEFKPVNDRFGHDAGDMLLVEVGQRLRQVVQSAGHVARLGGDEFVVVLEGVDDLAAAHAAGRGLHDAVALRPFTVAGSAVRVGVTVGYSLAPADGREVSSLLRCADAGMYAGKQSDASRVLRGVLVAGGVAGGVAGEVVAPARNRQDQDCPASMI